MTSYDLVIGENAFKYVEAEVMGRVEGTRLSDVFGEEGNEDNPVSEDLSSSDEDSEDTM